MNKNIPFASTLLPTIIVTKQGHSPSSEESEKVTRLTNKEEISFKGMGMGKRTELILLSYVVLVHLQLCLD